VSPNTRLGEFSGLVGNEDPLLRFLSSCRCHESFDSYLANHEAFFYVFDSIPLALSVGVFIYFWPPYALDASGAIIPTTSSVEMSGTKGRIPEVRGFSAGAGQGVFQKGYRNGRNQKPDGGPFQPL
jgi:hypothetical protein